MKPVAAVTPSQATPSETTVAAMSPPAIRILKITSCPSLSGRSTLTYHIGCTRQGMEDGPADVLIRVFTNSAAGFFSNEWVALDLIQLQLAQARDEKSLTSHLLFPLFKGKSANTPAFLFAVLKSEGLVRAVKDVKRLYEVVDTSAFMAAFKALMTSSVDLQVEEKLVKATPQINGKPAIKLKAAPAHPKVMSDAKPAKAKPRGAR